MPNTWSNDVETEEDVPKDRRVPSSEASQLGVSAERFHQEVPREYQRAVQRLSHRDSFTRGSNAEEEAENLVHDD